MAGEGQDLGRALLHPQLCSDTQGKEQGLWETGNCYQDGSLLGKVAKVRLSAESSPSPPGAKEVRLLQAA